MDFIDLKNIGKEYKGFVIVNVENIPDHKSKAVYLRHKTTGLEVYHLVNDDKENLFSFCFRTVAKNSKGAAHITEHSVLCGSEKFPLKEPFNTLDQQSLKTFLNAMTYPEKTLYPAASVVKSDYYNLMDVYADAVFFPKLSRQTFMQEGWRVELDEEGKASIQGIVYNEMKANYSTFNAIAVDKMLSAMYPDSILDYDSGGDPIHIPELTYEDFVAFHQKFYSPSNCLVFLYGDIPTSEQLDFLADKYIPRLEKAYGTITDLDLKSQTPYVDSEIKQIQKFHRIEKTKEVVEIAPDNGATGNMVAVGYYLGPNNIEQTFLSEILSGNDSSPMTKKLKASKLGEDEAPINGNFGYVQEDCIYCSGLSGVKPGNEKKVYELISKSFKEIYDEGISQSDIDAAIMSIDFTLREENRNFGPPSISIMSKTAASWSVGEKPSKLLNRISDFEEVKAKVRTNPDFVKELIKKYFIDAETILKFSVEPSPKYFEERNKIEAETLKSFEKNIDKEKLQKELDELHDYQNKLESEEELKCIPHLRVSDLNSDIYEIKTEYTTVKGKDHADIPVLINKENTNGIIYVDVLLPIDNLDPELFKYMNIFSAFTDNLGRKGKNWSESIAEEAGIFGDFNVKLHTSGERNSKEAAETISKYPNKDLANRNFLIFSTKFLADYIEPALNLLADVLVNTEYKDVEHAKTLFSEEINDLNESFIQNALKYISIYCKKEKSKSYAIRELLYGLTYFFNAKSWKSEDISSILEICSKMYAEIKAQGAAIHIICDDENMDKLVSLLPDFAVKAELTKLNPAKNYKKEDYLKYTYEPDNFDIKKTTFIQASAQAGYSVFISPCSGELTKELYAETILSSYLNGHQIWEKIRMQGGAYGGKCGVDGRDKLFSALSWRDPTPEKSLKAYIESLKEAVDFKFTKEDVERCILSEYSEFIVPDSPAGYGNRGLSRYLTGYSNEQYRKEIELLLQITPEDVHAAAERLYNEALKNNVSVVFCDNSINCCGNVIKIPL